MENLLNNKKLLRLIVIAAGATTVLGFAPFGYYLIPIISLALLLFVCSHSTSKETFLLGYLFGFAFFGVGVNWLHISINLFGGVNLVMAYCFTYLLVAFLSLYPALCVYLCHRYFHQTQFYVFPAAWGLSEWLRGWVFTGFPWLNIGVSHTDSMFSSLAPVIGVYGISTVVVSIASLAVVVFTGSNRQRLVSIILLLTILILSHFSHSLNWTQALGKDVRVALIQGAVPQAIKWKPDQRQPTLETYSQLSNPFWSADLIIWPETAIPSLYHQADDFIERITRDRADSNTVFLSGIAYKDNNSGNYYNSTLLIDDEHRFYHKNQLVPFGEYLPFKSILGKLLSFLQIPMSDFSSGDIDTKIMPTNIGVLGMSICYEDAYTSQMRATMPGANILINISNDAWFGDSLAPHQHLQIARMRALENGRYLLRATNTGISAIIDDRGKIIASSPQFQPHALTAEVTLQKGSTPYSRYGNSMILIYIFIFIMLAALYQRSVRLQV